MISLGEFYKKNNNFTDLKKNLRKTVVFDILYSKQQLVWSNSYFKSLFKENKIKVNVDSYEMHIKEL